MKIILSTNGHDYKSSAFADIEPSFSDGRLSVFVTVLRSHGSFVNRFRHYTQVLEGEKVILLCKYHGFSKGIQLSLTEPLGRTTHAKKHRHLIEVTLNRVTEENSGEYTCNAKDARKGLRRGVESVYLEVISNLCSNFYKIMHTHQPFRCFKASVYVWLLDRTGILVPYIASTYSVGF
jgi:hypothetical protein